MFRLFKKVLLVLSGLLLLGFIYLQTAPAVIGKTMGPSIRERIDRNFADVKNNQYDLIILGNSKIVQGLNPDKFYLPTYNFAHNDDAFNQCYYKLLYLEDVHKLPRYVLMGVDYFEFSFLSDARNYAYKPYFRAGYLEDFELSRSSFIDYKNHLNKSFNEWMELKFTSTAPVFIESILSPTTAGVPYMRPNGQYVEEGKASEDDFTPRDSSVLPLQLDYFNRVIRFCAEKNIRLFLLMPPVRSNELKNYQAGTINRFNRLFSSYPAAPFLNFSLDERFSIDDYIDIAHLNEAAADRFSSIVSDTLKHISASSHLNSIQ